MPYRRGSYDATVRASLAMTVLFGAVALAQAQAAQTRTVQDGVYTDAQASRGEGLYKQRCAGCHGPALAGAQAPPLAGPAFVDKWRREPLSGLFIKIRHTMPPGAPAPLTAQEGVDLTAHVLRANGFPAGKTDLAAADATTSPIGWPAGRGAGPGLPERLGGVPPGRAGGAAPAERAYPPAGTLAQLMRSVFFPSSNLIFTVQTRDPAAPVPPPDPAAKGAGFSVFEWGQGIYTGWPVIENAAAALADVSPLMLNPAMRCENGRLAPVTEADWIRFTDQMIVVARRTMRLAQTRNQEAVAEATGDLSDACAACHQVYRDVGGRGRGANPLSPGMNPARCTHR